MREKCDSPLSISYYLRNPHGGAVQATGVTSANTVGYRSKALNNFQFVGSTFTGVGGSESMTYGDLKTNCDLTGEVGTGWQAMLDAVVELNSNGSFVKKVVYVPAYIAGEYSAEAGWYEEDAVAIDEDYSDPLDDTPITFGLGIQVATVDGGDAAITFAGEVKPTATVTDLEGFMIVANCAEKTIKLDELITNCDLTGEIGTGWQAMLDAVVELNSNGSFVRKIVFVPAYIAGEYSAEAGWYEEDAVAIEEDYSTPLGQSITFQPGEAFQVATVVGGDATVSFKSALANE
ncbi:MAG: hypothetical protein IJG84_23420 [Kiritimatiellae bacterium]|nr:hypothetical protein [Kiritimatiellia bacterium]